MSNKIEAQAKITINKPLTQVYEYTINPSHAKDWYENVKTSTWDDKGGELVIGTKVKLLTHIMGKDFPFTYSIKTLDPNKRMHMVSTAGPFPMESEYLFQALSDTATEVTIINRAEPKGIPFFMVSIVKGKVQKTIEEDVVRLKNILEAQ